MHYRSKKQKKDSNESSIENSKIYSSTTSSSSSSNLSSEKIRNSINEKEMKENCENEDFLINKLNINEDHDPFREAPFKYAKSASSSLTASSNSLKASNSLNSNEQLHKSAFQPYKRPDDPFINAPFESSSNPNKINPFVNAPFTNYENRKKQQQQQQQPQNQFDYSKFGSKKKAKKVSKQSIDDAHSNQIELQNKKLNNEKATNLLTQSQSLNSITTTANVNAASIITTLSTNSAFTTSISPSNCTGTITPFASTTVPTSSLLATTTITEITNNNNHTPISSSSSASSSCTSFAMNLIDKPIIATSTTLTKSELTIKQKSSTLPPLTIPLSAAKCNNNNSNSTASILNSAKLSTLPKCKPSNEGLITTIYVNNNNSNNIFEFDKSNNLKNCNLPSTPLKLANNNDQINEEFNKTNRENKKQKNSSKSSTPLKSPSNAHNKGFSNMSFNDF